MPRHGDKEKRRDGLWLPDLELRAVRASGPKMVGIIG